MHGVVITSNTFATASQAFALELLDAISGKQLHGSTYTHIPHRLDAPRLLSPPDHAEVDSDSVTLSWTPVPHAFTYICEYASDSLFTDSHADTTHGTSLTLNAIVSGESIYWRVRAHNAYLYNGTSGPFSDSSRFHVRSVSNIATAVPTAPLIVYPNPAADAVHISVPDENTITRIELHSLTGRLLQQRNIDRRSHITLSLHGVRERILLLVVATNEGRYIRHTLLRKP